MKFTWENKEKIDDIYIHDSILEGYSHDYYNRKMILKAVYTGLVNTRIEFTFHNVIMHKLQSCCLWGPGVHVLVVYYDEENILLKEAMELQRVTKEKSGSLYMDENTSYISIVFEMNSGDSIMIVCESFEYEEY